MPSLFNDLSWLVEFKSYDYEVAAIKDILDTAFDSVYFKEDQGWEMVGLGHWRVSDAGRESKKQALSAPAATEG